jgi:ribosomal protein S18 acetylase RimI-like enzyme
VGQDLLAAIHQNYLVALTRIGTLAPGSSTRLLGCWRLVDAAVESEEFNVAAARRRPRDAQAAVGRAIEWFGGRHAPFRFVLRSGEDAALEEAALARHFQQSGTTPAMLLGAAPQLLTLTPDLELHEIRAPADLEAYSREGALATDPEFLLQRSMAASVAGWPGFVPIVAVHRDAGTVGCAMAVLAGDITGVFNMHVTPAFRRQGVGRALTAAVLDVGRRAGFEAACLEATAEGLALYEAMGFRTVFEYRSFGR